MQSESGETDSWVTRMMLQSSQHFFVQRRLQLVRVCMHCRETYRRFGVTTDKLLCQSVSPTFSTSLLCAPCRLSCVQPAGFSLSMSCPSVFYQHGRLWSQASRGVRSQQGRETTMLQPVERVSHRSLYPPHVSWKAGFVSRCGTIDVQGDACASGEQWMKRRKKKKRREHNPLEDLKGTACSLHTLQNRGLKCNTHLYCRRKVHNW